MDEESEKSERQGKKNSKRKNLAWEEEKNSVRCDHNSYKKNAGVTADVDLMPLNL